MKRHYLKIFTATLIVAGISLSGCKKLLEIEETDLIAGDLALATVENCEQGIIGAYSGIGTETEILMNAVFSDEVKTVEFYNAQTTHEWTYGEQDIAIRDSYRPINADYRAIDRVNRVLIALPNAEEKRAGDAALKSRLQGEALFIRAYSHFRLYMFYCKNYDPAGLGMPYMETPSLLPVARLDMGTYFTKMLADLTAAKALLPASLADINRANLQAANALHARIALHMRDWATAEAQATSYINALPLATIAEFPGIWNDISTKEIAFQVVRNPSVGSRIGSLFRGITSGGQIGTITWGPSNKLWNSYDPVNDVRFKSYLIDEPLLSAAGRPSKIINKYAGTGYGTPSENINNLKIFRTGEMVLIRAEARARQGKFTGANSAESDINLLRSNRITGNTPVTFASQDAAITAIIQERFKELAFEGHRFFDLRRYNLPVQRNVDDAPNPTATTLPAGNFRFILPIYLNDRQANPLLEQNEGYF